MAVNKNFVVKNGLEVSTDLILANASTNKVGIATTTPEYTLHVNGGIGATDSYISGISTVAENFHVGTAGTIFSVDALTGIGSVGVGTAAPAYLLDVRSPVSTGQTALYVYGDMRVTGDINLDDITLDDASIQNLTVTDTLHVTGLTTFVGFTTFSDYIFVQDGLNVTGAGITSPNINVSGVVTATQFIGLGQIGVGSEGTSIGTGVTMVDFKSSNAGNTVDLASGIATVTVQTGASIGLVIALGG